MNTDKRHNTVARIKQTTIVKERSNAMVSTIVDNDNNMDMVLFQPNTNFMIKQQIMCVPMLTEYVNGCIEVLVINKTDQPIKLYHRSRIGNILPVSEVKEQNTVTLIQQQTSGMLKMMSDKSRSRLHKRTHLISFLNH